MVGFPGAYTDSRDPFGKGLARLQHLPTDPERGGVPTPCPGGWHWAGTVLVLVLVLGWHGAGAGPAAVGSTVALLPGLAAIAAPGGLAPHEHRSPLPPGTGRGDGGTGAAGGWGCSWWDVPGCGPEGWLVGSRWSYTVF